MPVQTLNKFQGMTDVSYQNCHVCACTCIHRERTLMFMKLAICICLLFTIVSVTSCVVCVRSALFTQEHLAICQELQKSTHAQRAVFDSIPRTQEFPSHLDQSEGVYHVSRDRRQATKPKKSKKKRRGQGNKKFCKKVSKCSQPLTAPDYSKVVLKASHFSVDGSTISGHVIGALQPAKWINEHEKQAVTSSDNVVSIKESGVYLVYSSVLFNDTKYREGLVVQKNNEPLFKCFDGVDHIDVNKSRQQNYKFKTCSVSGVTYLSQGDTLKMVNLYPDTNIDTSEGSTFFGLIQLIPAT